MKKISKIEHKAILLKLLKNIRVESGLRQADLARTLGEPQSFISKYESGERRLDLIEIEEICDVLGIPLSVFINRFEKETK